jgi:hypothetical protein
MEITRAGPDTYFFGAAAANVLRKVGASERRRFATY